MQSSRFDALSRWASQRITRRTAVAQAGASIVAALGVTSLVNPVVAQDATPAATPVPAADPGTTSPISLLYLQNAGVTTLTPGTGDVHTLTMTGVPAQTLYFSDRPNRIAGNEPTATFVDGFAAAFADSAPNATLVGHFEVGGHEDEAVVLTLLSATYDEATATLTYKVTLLDADLITDVTYEHEPLTVLDGPREYAEASLFIDMFECLTCFTIQCVGKGPGPCDQQGTNCCDDQCTRRGWISMWATFESCVDSDTTTDPITSTANWSCVCG